MEVVASLSQGRTAAAQCGLFAHKSVPVIFEPPCINDAHLLFVAGSIMFLLTMFMMGGPQKPEKPRDMGHENAGFTLDKIAEMNGTVNRPAIESSRL